MPQCFIPDVPGVEFCIVFCRKDSRLMGHNAFASVYLTFSFAGINIVLPCLQALGIYTIAGQGLMCMYF